MKVAFCIPTTSAKRDWKTMQETFLLQFNDIQTQHEITYFIGYDKGDPLFSIPENQNQFKANWVECDFEKGHVTAIWNKLYKQALAKQEFDYFWLAGDDIAYAEEDWLDLLTIELSKTEGIGIAGVYNGNPNLPMTQFLVSKRHYDLFKFAYPPEIKNWYCDDWITEVYPSKYVHFRPDIECLNSGGEPRYKPDNTNTEWKELVKYYRVLLSQNNGFKYIDNTIGNRFKSNDEHKKTGTSLFNQFKNRLKKVLGGNT